MKKKLIIIISIILLVILIFLTIFKADAEDKPFSQVQLSENNTVVNNIHPKYYDTIISVSLDQSGLKGLVIVVNELRSESKDNSGLDKLNAHVREFNGVFYLFMEEFDRMKAIEIICHEVIHINQYYSGQLKYSDESLLWNDEIFLLNEIEYDSRPWELDAYEKGTILSKNVTSVLYQ